MTLQEALEHFLFDRLRSPKTIMSLRYSLQLIFRELGPNRPVASITTADLVRFLNDQAARGLSEWTVAIRARDLHTFFRWCTQVGLVNRSPADNIPVPQYQPQPLESLMMSDDDVDRLLRYARQDHSRTYAILATLVGTGCRRQELLNLRTEDVDRAKRLLVIRGKGRKRRTAPLLSWVQDALDGWLADRPDAPHDFVICSLALPHEPLTVEGLATLWRRLVRRAGLRGTRTNMHVIRHWFASRLARSGANLVYIQELLGHGSISTTRLYVHTSLDDLRTTMMEALVQFPS